MLLKPHNFVEELKVEFNALTGKLSTMLCVAQHILISLNVKIWRKERKKLAGSGPSNKLMLLNVEMSFCRLIT